MVAVPIEVTVVRLYRKSPGSPHLRKRAAAELAALLAGGWRETQRTTGSDHVVLRLERPRPAELSIRATQGGPGRSGR
ncbi:MAG: hypothetical protein ACRDY7_08905 [Acidimicrobiia bacterium]